MITPRPTEGRRSRRLPSSFSSQSRELPLLELHFSPVLTAHVDEADELCLHLLSLHSAGRLERVGFDIEWSVTYVRNAAPRNVATVQIASHGGCIIFQLARMRGVFPKALAQLLELPSLVKVGVGIGNDGTKLRADYGVRAAGLLDLSAAASLVLPDGVRSWSLAELCERTLGGRLCKSNELRCSDWEAQLSYEQIRYAALDAWAAVPPYRKPVAS